MCSRVPTNDEDGRVVVLLFVHELESSGTLRLIDIEAGDGAAVIVLVDGAVA
jgi:hypothetical protein